MDQQESAADSPGEFSVNIKTLDGQTFSVSVSLDDTVRDLKAKLNAQDSSRIPEQGRLICNNREMEDDQTLQYYKVTPNSVLYHIRRCK